MIEAFGSHLNIDLQQRGVEFAQLFRDYSHLRPALLEKMPKIQKTLPNGTDAEGGGFDDQQPTIDLIEGGDDGDSSLMINTSGGMVGKMGSDSVSSAIWLSIEKGFYFNKLFPFSAPCSICSVEGTIRSMGWH